MLGRDEASTWGKERKKCIYGQMKRVILNNYLDEDKRADHLNGFGKKPKILEGAGAYQLLHNIS